MRIYVLFEAIQKTCYYLYLMRLYTCNLSQKFCSHILTSFLTIRFNILFSVSSFNAIYKFTSLLGYIHLAIRILLNSLHDKIYGLHQERQQFDQVFFIFSSRQSEEDLLALSMVQEPIYFIIKFTTPPCLIFT